MENCKKNINGIVKRGIMILLAVMLMLSTAACGSKDFSKNFVGVWEVTEVVAEGLTVNGEMLETFGVTGSIDFRADKTMIFELMGDSTEGKWEAKDEKTVTITPDDEESATATLADGNLTIEVDETKMVFSKKE